MTRFPLGFGAKILAKRQKLGLSVMELAEKTGLNRENLYKLEREQTEPSLRTAIILAHVLGIRMSALVPELPDDLVPL